MLRGQNSRHSLYLDWHTTPSKIMHGFFIRSIFPVFSLRIFVTRRRTRYARPQYGTISASKVMPRFRLPAVAGGEDFFVALYADQFSRLEVQLGGGGVRPSRDRAVPAGKLEAASKPRGSVVKPAQDPPATHSGQPFVTHVNETARPSGATRYCPKCNLRYIASIPTRKGALSRPGPASPGRHKRVPLVPPGREPLRTGQRPPRCIGPARLSGRPGLPFNAGLFPHPHREGRPSATMHPSKRSCTRPHTRRGIAHRNELHPDGLHRSSFAPCIPR